MFVSGRDSVVSKWILYGWVILRSTKQKHVGIWTTTIPASNFTKYLFWSWPWELCPGALVVNEMNISDESFNCLHNAKFTFLKKSCLYICIMCFTPTGGNESPKNLWSNMQGGDMSVTSPPHRNSNDNSSATDQKASLLQKLLSE